MQTFISYNHGDVDFAMRLRDKLRDWGYNIWIDIEAIRAGMFWADEIDVGLESSEVIIGVVTPKSVSSSNVKKEWQWGIENGKRVLPLLLRTAKFPHQITGLHYIDFRTDENTGFVKLREALSDKNSPLYADAFAPAAAPPTPAKPGTTSVSPKARYTDDINRVRMLQKVYHSWVEGVLQHSIYEDVYELGLTLKPDAVIKNVTYGDYKLPTSVNILKIFNDTGRQLLILGTPGAGKTILLLQLAEGLLEEARNDQTKPIPVIFNLSSWAVRRLPLDQWLIEELATKYQAPPKIGQKWIADEKLLLLLDGLDEVDLAYSNQCVETINAFCEKHQTVELAVCSRIGDYEDLTTRLKLENAILVNSLSFDRIGTILGNNDKVKGLWTAVQQNPVLRQITINLFLLHTMLFTYQGENRLELSGIESEEEFSARLFAHFVRKQFDREPNDKYTLAQLRAWLIWLAGQMHKNSQTLFLIENIQPEWLPTRKQRWLYDVILRFVGNSLGGLVAGLILGFVLAQVLGTLDALNVVLPIAMAITLPIGVTFGLARNLARGLTGEFQKVDVPKVSHAVHSGARLGVTTATVAGILAGWLWDVQTALLVAFAFAAIGVSFGLLAALLFKAPLADEVKVVEKLYWSWKRAASGLLIGGVLGLVIFGVFSITFSLIFGSSNISRGIPIGTAIGLTTMLVFSLSVGLFDNQVYEKTRPNEGIVRSVQNAVMSGIMFGALVLVITTIVLGSQVGVIAGIVVGLVFAAMFGGLAGIQHLILRSFLRHSDRMPWNYAEFLDFAASRGLLYKVGGGYIFAHRQLLDYFADIANSQNKTTD